jgi:GNAT superfamily N-acetyltransferase
MNELKLIHDYKDINEYRQSFNQLAKSTFGIDFEKWYQKGFWDDRYICYSYVDGNQVIANVSINKMDVILEGERKRALQIGTVMTHPEYRKKGLSARLMNTVLDEYEKSHEFIYLFANETVLDFYPKFGFNQFDESQFSINVTLSKCNPSNVRKLDISDSYDLKKIINLASVRLPISNVFGVENALGIFAWHCLNVFYDDIYYLEGEDIIVICKREQERLHVYDVISKETVQFNHILSKVASEDIKKVLFYFTPEFPDITPDYSFFKADDVLFIRPSSTGITRDFKCPITAQA